MKTILRTVLFACTLMCIPVHAAEVDFSDADSLSRWITYYYAKPEPNRVAEAVLSASSQGFMGNGNSTGAFIGFIAGVMSDDPTMAQSLAEQLVSLPPVDQPALILGVWYSTYPEAKPLLERFRESMPEQRGMIDGLLGGDRRGLLDLPLEQGPWVLDALWGNFLATGDDAPVVRIISALPWADVRGDVPRLLIGHAARWSLISNAIQHGSVMEVCKRELAAQPQGVATALAGVIAEAERDMREGKKR